MEGRASAVLGSLGEPFAWFEPTRVSTLRQVTAATKVSSLRRSRGLDESPFSAKASTTFVMQRLARVRSFALCDLLPPRREGAISKMVVKCVREGVMVGVDGCGWVRLG